MLKNYLEWSASSLGYLSFLGITIAFYPALSGICNRKRSNNKMFNTLTLWSLAITIGAGLSHGLLMTQKENINFYDIKTYWIYGEALLTLNLIVFLTFGFNQLKFDFQKFVYLVYTLLFFLGCHLSSAIAKG